jgi:hypothetical protein
MPFIPHTPESLVSRADSKNPATTCKGVTANGRPCRRALAASRGSSPNAKHGSRDGVVAFISEDGDNHEGAAAFFCWQHKEQAVSLATANQCGRKAGVIKLQERTSLDTLVDRLGILDVEDNGILTPGGHTIEKTRRARKEHLPKNWQNVPGPLVSIKTNGSAPEKKRSSRHGRRKSRPRTKFVFSLSCCTTTSDPNESLPAPIQRDSGQHADSHVRTAKVPQFVRRPDVHTPTSSQRKQHGGHSEKPIPESDVLIPVASHRDTGISRPSLARDSPSRTQELLSLMPRSLSPQTTSLLLAELAKPISDHDEPGYIYMFWLTPETLPAPTQEATSSLLASPGLSRPSRNRRTTDVIRQYNPSSSTNNSTILLKIGRASNVQRRMNEWSRQCSHNLSVLRYYPYLPSSHGSPPSLPSSSPDSPRKVPHAHKVERLIHLELAHLRVKRECVACGKEHREWFEVDGRRERVEEVDRVVKRWVDYGMGMRNDIRQGTHSHQMQ